MLSEEQLIPRSALRYRPIGSTQATMEVLPWIASSSRPSRTKRQTISSSQIILVLQHWLHAQHITVLIGLGMVLVLLFVQIGQLAIMWGTVGWDDLHYGRPRTFQLDAFVGYEQTGVPSHFIATNLHGRVYVIEFPDGDASHTHIYQGPQITGPDADLVPVTLRLATNDAHPDLIVQCGSAQIRLSTLQQSLSP